MSTAGHKQRKPKAPKSGENAPAKPDAEEVNPEEETLNVKKAAPLKKAAAKKAAAKRAAKNKDKSDKVDKADKSNQSKPDESGAEEKDDKDKAEEAETEEEENKSETESEVKSKANSEEEVKEPAKKAAKEKKELSAKRQAYAGAGMSFAVARVRQEMNKNGINRFVNNEILKAKTSEDTARAKALSNTKTRFSEKAFVAASMALEKIITPLVEHGFATTLESGHKTLSLKYLYSAGFEKNPFHNLLNRIDVYAEQSQKAFADIALANIEKAHNQAKRDLAKSYKLTKRTSRNSAEAEAEEAPEDEVIAETEAETNEKRHFEHYIAQFCKNFAANKEVRLHTSRLVLKHLSEIVLGLNHIISRVSYELTLVPGNKTISEGNIFTAIKVCLIDCTHVEESFEDGDEGKVNRIVKDSSFAESFVESIRATLDKYATALPPKVKKSKVSAPPSAGIVEENSGNSGSESGDAGDMKPLLSVNPANNDPVSAAEVLTGSAVPPAGDYRNQDPSHFVEAANPIIQ